jgi:DNA helicase-2/ATP-dependent DNA helicase PcrA
MQFTTEQTAVHDAIRCGKGNMAVNATAGSGKTETAVQGINIAAEANPAHNILYVVFGTKNAAEARERILAQNVTIKTFNALGHSFVSSHWRGIRADKFAEYGRCQSLQPKAPKQLIFLAQQLVGMAKNRVVNPNFQELLTLANTQGIAPNKSSEFEIDDIVNLAHKSLQLAINRPRDGKISFDDQVWLPTRLNLYNPTFDWIFADENQDANLMNYNAIEKLINPSGRICLIGDENQQLFGFRGSVNKGMMTFASKIKAVNYPMTINFRCGKKIVAEAKKVVPEIEAFDGSIDGEVESFNEDKMLAEIKVNEVILSRTNAPLIRHAMALIRRNKPAFIEGREIAKVLTDIVDSLECKEISELPGKLDVWLQVRVSKASGWDATRMIEQWTDQAETLKALAENAKTIEDVTAKITSLFYDSDYVRVPSVILSTVHKFKGRQAKTTYLIEKSFQKRGNQPVDDHCEKCCRFVALTRAREKLVYVN